MAAHRGHGGTEEYTCRLAEARKASYIYSSDILLAAPASVPNSPSSLLPFTPRHRCLPPTHMSDNEGHGGLPPTDDDLSLPKATVAKMISGAKHALFVFTRVSSSAPFASLVYRVPAERCFVREGDERLDH